MTRQQEALARERIRGWPREEIRWAAKLPPREQALIAELAALLDIRPT